MRECQFMSAIATINRHLKCDSTIGTESGQSNEISVVFEFIPNSERVDEGQFDERMRDKLVTIDLNAKLYFDLVILTNN